MNTDFMVNVIMGVGSALSGAVLVLFKMVMTQYKEQVVLSRKVGELEGKQNGVTDLSNKVLDIVRKNTEER